MSTQINGPINVVRMEGEIDNVKKCIYIFMDTHYDLGQQLECDDVFAKDVNVYFAEKFRELNESDKKFDFFLEIRPTNLQNVSHGFSVSVDANHRTIYIGQVMKLFRKFFNYDPKENKVDTSEIFKNVRLHYMDVRDYFQTTSYIIFDLQHAADHVWNYYALDGYVLDNIIQSLDSLKNNYVAISNILDNISPNKKL